jgi:predicted branched-subunit amino acid permease
MADDLLVAPGPPSEEPVGFDVTGAAAGARRALPIALSVCAYGLVFGVLAQQAQLSLLEVALMSGFVFAGSAQLIVLSLWAMPLPRFCSPPDRQPAQSAAGSRHQSLFPHGFPSQAYLTLFFMTDENWALTMGEFCQGRRNAAFLLGSGLVLYVAWVGSTWWGALGDGARSAASDWILPSRCWWGIMEGEI